MAKHYSRNGLDNGNRGNKGSGRIKDVLAGTSKPSKKFNGTNKHGDSRKGSGQNGTSKKSYRGGGFRF